MKPTSRCMGSKLSGMIPGRPHRTPVESEAQTRKAKSSTRLGVVGGSTQVDDLSTSVMIQNLVPRLSVYDERKLPCRAGQCITTDEFIDRKSTRLNSSH